MPSCGWCNAPELPRWEARLAAGESVALIALDTPFSLQAAYRHIRHHLKPRLAIERRDVASSIHLSDFAERLLQLAGKAAAVGDYANETNNGKLALAAIQQERETLTTLSGRLGVESTEVLDILREAKALVRAINRVINAAAPLDLETLAWYIESEGAGEIADALRTRAREHDLTSTTERQPEGIRP